jgi:hypothetical protein
MNISHTQLDDCRSNPRSWVQAKAGPPPFFSFGDNQAVLHAIHHYHRSNGDARGARQYLQECIDRNFENEDRSDQIKDWLDAYIKWYRQSGVIVADSKFRIKLNLGVFLELRGELHLRMIHTPREAIFNKLQGFLVFLHFGFQVAFVLTR